MPQLKQEQFLPIPIQEAWKFFATPENLNIITPGTLDFKMTSALPDKMHKGLLISYIIKPMLNIPVKWITEITELNEPYFFIDEQRKGPYAIWHHEHYFKEVEGGVIMTDIVDYEIGKSFIGWIAGKLFVHRKVKEIFRYRYTVLQDYFKKK